MATNPIPSRGLHFIRKLGVAFFWAFVFSAVFGPAAYHRIDRRVLDDDAPWHVAPRLWVEKLEWLTFDWRARELGALSRPSDDVVIVAVDDETVANARESEKPEWAISPWPREFIGALIQQALAEGASLVVVDEALSDVSAYRSSSSAKADRSRGDDDVLADLLGRTQGRVVLSFEWSPKPARMADRPLLPFVVKVGETRSQAQVLELVQAVLRRQPSALVIPIEDKSGWVVWAPASSEAKARDLANAIELAGASEIRSLRPADDAFEVNRQWLAARRSELNHAGLDFSEAPKAASLEVPVPSVLRAGVGFGANSIRADADHVVRSIPLLVATADREGTPSLHPSVPLEAIRRLEGDGGVEWDGRWLRVDGSRVPTDSQGFMTLSWSAAEGAHGRGTLKRAIPAWRLMVNRQDDEAHRGVRHHDNDLVGRIVVFTDERSVGQRLYETPVGPLSRAAITGQAIVDLRSGRAITRVPPEVDMWITLAFAFMGATLALAWSTLLRRPGWLIWLLTMAAVVGLSALVARQLFVTQQRWVALVAPLLAWGFTFLASLGYARTLERSLREFVSRALGGAVRADVFQSVERDLALMHPERRTMTVYFSDIEGFTGVVQERAPKVVVKVLREYLADMTPVILDSAGHVDKYLGDGLMAFWGAPVELPSQVVTACEVALTLKRHFNQKREEWEKVCGRPLMMRAGIETGPTVVGEMGTSHRVNYTVMGKPVARAFRLESLAKRYGVRIMVGEEVKRAAGEDFCFRSVDRVRLSRGEIPVELFELVDRRAGSAEDLAWVVTYEAAMAAFRAMRFAEALAAFEALREARPDDPLTARYIRRARHLIEHPPQPEWDGLSFGPEGD